MTARMIWLGLNALMFVLFGLVFAVDPQRAVPLFLGVPAPGGDLLIDVRATYGGLSLALGSFMAWCIVRREHLPLGLLISFLVALCLVTVRAIGVATAGSAGPVQYQSLVLELGLSVLFGWLYFARPKS